MLSDRLMALIRNPETPPYVLRDAVTEEEEAVANVYVVSGKTGQYSDRRSWTVAAYLEPSQAEAFCERLNEWCRQQKCDWEQKRVDYDLRDDLRCPLDPEFQCDYTGTLYTVWTIPLRVEEGS